MLAVVQFPISDTRPFIVGTPLRCSKPNFRGSTSWGNNREFVRCFGPAADRWLEVDPLFTDEQTYFKAGGALQFIDLRSQRLMPAPLHIAPACAFRRLFCDGSALARVEIGITKFRNMPPLPPFNGRQCLSVATDIMKLPTRVRDFRLGFVEERHVVFQPDDALVRQGNRLSKLFSRATAAASESQTIRDSYVKDGRPVLIVEFDLAEISKLPAQVQIVDPHKVGGVQLGFTWLRGSAGLVGAWFIRRDKSNSLGHRRLRLCLLRLHAEREVLHSVLRQLDSGQIVYQANTEAGDNLDRYLNRAVTMVQRDQHYGVSQSAILEAFDAVESVEPATRLSDLTQRLSGARRQVIEKVDNYQMNRRDIGVVNVTNVLGDQIVIEQISHSQIGAIGSDSAGVVSGNQSSDLS